jgi:hypothetical protein
LIQGEDELTRETRIFELEAEIQRVREQQEIARMAGRIHAAHPNTVSSTPLSSSGLHPPALPSSPATGFPSSNSDPEEPDVSLTDPFGTMNDVEMFPPEADGFPSRYIYILIFLDDFV